MRLDIRPEHFQEVGAVPPVLNIFHEDFAYAYRPVFRAAQCTEMGRMIFDEHMKKGMMTALIRRVGELAGFKHNTISYTLRYMAGNKMDRCHTYSLYFTAALFI